MRSTRQCGSADSRLARTQPADPATAVVMEELVEMGGSGGIISLDKDGNVALIFNSESMFRGWVKAGQDPVTGIYKD